MMRKDKKFGSLSMKRLLGNPSGLSPGLSTKKLINDPKGTKPSNIDCQLLSMSVKQCKRVRTTTRRKQKKMSRTL